MKFGRRAALEMAGALLVGCAGSAPRPKEASKMNLHQTMARRVGSGEVPGLVTLVSKHGAARVDAIGMKRNAIFRISSMTKPITAYAAMLLVEEGKIRLDEPVDRLLPELANRRVLERPDATLDRTVPARRPIHVRDLLSFTMGIGIVFAPPGTLPIQRAMDEMKLGQGIPSPQTPPAPDEWMRRLGSLPLIHQPGETWMYNTGSDVLGVLVARASGKSFEDFLRERVFEPLGMKDTGFFVPATKIDRLPPSYVVDPKTKALALYDPPNGQWSKPPAFPSGAAGLVSTIDDYFAFGQRMLSRDVLTRERTPAAREFLENRVWGFGVAIATDGDESGSPGSFGWDGGLGTSWRSDPKEDSVRILMTQRAWESPSAPDLCREFWKAARKEI